jgi:hypothetical protein
LPIFTLISAKYNDEVRNIKTYLSQTDALKEIMRKWD